MFLHAELSFADAFDNDIAMRLVYSGCKRASEGRPCRGCHNPDLWSFDRKADSNMRWIKLERQLYGWKKQDAWITALSIIGGEPLDQTDKEAEKTLSLVDTYFPDLTVVLYTGYDEEAFFEKKLNKHPFAVKASYIKFGPYIEEMSVSVPPADDTPKPWLASKNQRLYKTEGGRIIEKIR